MLGFFTIVLIVSKAFEGSTFFRDLKFTDLLTTTFTFALALFTLGLVCVASTQTEILSHTDQTLQLAASAQSASAQTAEKLRLLTSATERAWIGVTSARSDPVEVGKPLSINIYYDNTGHLLAYFKVANGGKFYTKNEWQNGNVRVIVEMYQKKCMDGTFIDVPNVTSGIVYPATGSSPYVMNYNSNTENFPEAQRFLVEKDQLGSRVTICIIRLFRLCDSWIH
jgi:hypothetical protein